MSSHAASGTGRQEDTTGTDWWDTTKARSAPLDLIITSTPTEEGPLDVYMDHLRDAEYLKLHQASTITNSTAVDVVQAASEPSATIVSPEQHVPVERPPPDFCGTWIVDFENQLRDAHEPDSLVSKAVKHARNVVSFMHVAVADEDEEDGDQSFTFYFSQRLNGFFFVLADIHAPVPEASLPSLPPNLDISLIPTHLFKWPPVPHHLVVIPPATMVDMDTRVELMNQQVEYWTHQIFYTKSIQSIDRRHQDRRLCMVRYWLELTGQTRVYKFAELFGQQPYYQRRGPRQMFWSMLAHERTTIRDEFIAAESEAGRRKYFDNFVIGHLDNEWYED